MFAIDFIDLTCHTLCVGVNGNIGIGNRLAIDLERADDIHRAERSNNNIAQSIANNKAIAVCCIKTYCSNDCSGTILPRECILQLRIIFGVGSIAEVDASPGTVYREKSIDLCRSTLTNDFEDWSLGQLAIIDRKVAKLRAATLNAIVVDTHCALIGNILSIVNITALNMDCTDAGVIAE